MQDDSNVEWSHKKHVCQGKMIESNRKKQLASLLTTYSLSNTINFATRIQNNSNTAFDNMFVDNSIINLLSIYPINGLSDHIAQILKIKIYMQQQMFIHGSSKPD